MATRFLADCVAVGRAEAILPARPVSPATSTLRSLRLRHTTPRVRVPSLVRRAVPPQPSAAPACQRAAPRFGARRAYPTLDRMSRVTSVECSDSAPAAPSRPPGCPGGRGCVGPSLKEPDKNTTRSTLCQVGQVRFEATLSLLLRVREQANLVPRYDCYVKLRGAV